MRAHIMSLIITILLIGNYALATTDDGKDANTNANTRTETTSQPARESDQPSAAPRSSVAADPSPSPTPQQSAAQGGPLPFKIGAAQFTPGGFLDMAAYYRS